VTLDFRLSGALRRPAVQTWPLKFIQQRLDSVGMDVWSRGMVRDARFESEDEPVCGGLPAREGDPSRAVERIAT
jgi:hypothetical protein